MSGKKFDSEKPMMDLIPPEALDQVARVLTMGAKKYGRHNWQKGIAYSRVISALMRHLNAFNAGEDKDPESGLSHMAHVATNAAFLLHFIKNNPELDDRPCATEETWPSPTHNDCGAV